MLDSVGVVTKLVTGYGTDTSDFSATYEYSTTEQELSERTRERVRSQRRQLRRVERHTMKMRASMRKNENIIRSIEEGHWERVGGVDYYRPDGDFAGQQRADESEDSEDEKEGQRSAYHARSMFDMLYSKGDDETPSERAARLALRARWEPLLETTLKEQEDYLAEFTNDRRTRVRRHGRGKHAWRKERLPQELREVLKEEPDLDYVSKVERQLLEYMGRVSDILNEHSEAVRMFNERKEEKREKKEEKKEEKKKERDSEDESSSDDSLPSEPVISPFVLHVKNKMHKVLAQCVGEFYGFGWRVMGKREKRERRMKKEEKERKKEEKEEKEEEEEKDKEEEEEEEEKMDVMERGRGGGCVVFMGVRKVLENLPGATVCECAAKWEMEKEEREGVRRRFKEDRGEEGERRKRKQKEREKEMKEKEMKEKKMEEKEGEERGREEKRKKRKVIGEDGVAIDIELDSLEREKRKEKRRRRKHRWRENTKKEKEKEKEKEDEKEEEVEDEEEEEDDDDDENEEEKKEEKGKEKKRKEKKGEERIGGRLSELVKEREDVEGSRKKIKNWGENEGGESGKMLQSLIKKKEKEKK